MYNISSGKIFSYPDRLQKISEGQAPFPVCIEIHLTNQCQMRCIHCHFNDRDATFSLEYNNLKTFLDIFSKNGGKSILWSGGGEPTLFRDKSYLLEDVIEMAATYHLKQGVYTNGLNMNPKLKQTLLKHCTFLRFSLDAFNNRTYRNLHKNSCLDQVIENIKNCLALRNKNNSNTTIGISYVLYKQNTGDLLRLKSFAKCVRPDYIYFRPGIYPEYKKYIVAFQYFLLKKIKKSKIPVRIEISNYKFQSLLSGTDYTYDSCYNGNLFPTLAADGYIYLCCHHICKQSHKIGSITDDLSELFSKLHITKDFANCPLNCRGNLLNQDIQTYFDLLDNEHTSFL